MDTQHKPHRRRWQKKRWWFAAVLWLAAGYPLTAGPAIYARERGWLPESVYTTVWFPLYLHCPLWLNRATGFSLYLDWWLDRMMEHEGKEWVPTEPPVPNSN